MAGWHHAGEKRKSFSCNAMIVQPQGVFRGLGFKSRYLLLSTRHWPKDEYGYRCTQLSGTHKPGTAARVTVDTASSNAGNLPIPLVTRVLFNAQAGQSLATRQGIQADEIRKCPLMSKKLELEHQLDDGLARVAGFSGRLELGKIIGPQRVLTYGELVEVVPGEQSAVMTVVEGQFQCVLPGRFDLGQADIELAKLQDRIAVALDLGGRRVRSSSAEVVDLAGRR